MTSYRVEVVVRAACTDSTSDIESFVDRMTDELMDLESVDDRVRDVDVSAVLADGIIAVEAIIDAKSADAALGYGEATVRCAGHAAGAGTPGWCVVANSDSKVMATA